MLKKISAVFIVSFFLVFSFVMLVKADELDDVSRQLETLKSDLSLKQGNQQKLLTQLNSIKSRLDVLAVEIQKKEKEVKDGEIALSYQKTLLDERAKSYYKNITKDTISLVNILISQNLSESLRSFFYQKSLSEQDKQTIIKIVLYIKKLEQIKIDLESEKVRMAELKQEVDKQSQILSAQISETQQKIAVLSARQQQLIAQKLASLNISRSASSMGRCDSDLTNGRDPGFSPRIAFFTYGVPNRVGLNQWGAYGRAKQGQGYEQILRAYYNFDEIKGFDTNIKIRVDGHGEYSLDDYVKRIYEVPGDWSVEVLKAQAIAARSYVLAYTNNGSGSICDSESCQVFKDDPKGGAWDSAVNDTAGKAMAQGGNAIKAWFSSTHGGYVFSSGEIGWSGTSWTKHATDASSGVNSFSDLNNNAYDKESPWFYCDWGSRSDYNKTAWLKSSEVADIANVIMLAKRDSTVGEHLYQPDKSNPAGTDTWDAEKVKSELRSRGGSPIDSASDISVSADFGSGRSTSISINGNSFDAGEFKNWFNLRAPANVQIVGPLFNVEKR
jgi:SpoIID/LytB domain protein